MHVVFGVVGNIIVEDVADIRDVQAPGGDVRRAQELEVAVSEGVQGPHPGLLVEIAVDGGGVEAVRAQGLGDDVHFGLPVAEDDPVLDPLVLDQHPQSGTLGLGVRGRKTDNVLGDGLGGGGGFGHLDADRIVEELLGQPRDLGRHGRREEQDLLLGRGQLEDPLDVGNEAHVEHAIRFVDHEDLHSGQEQLAPFEVVQQPTGGRDQDVNAAIELEFLVVEGDPADQQGPGQLPGLTCGVALEGG